MKNTEHSSNYRVGGLSGRDVDRWMRRRHYQKIDFQGQDFRTSTYWGNKEVFYKIEYQRDREVYYREGAYGGLIVMELEMTPGELSIRGYCPWLVFGMFTIKWSFKERPLSWMKYRKEGHYDLVALERWLDEFGS